MTWRRLAFKNLLHNARRYLGYMASSACAVLVFFMFSAFSLNPSVKDGYMTANARYVLTGCQYIILVFAIFFILFFHAALVRMRSREFALFRVLGMSPGQVWRNVFVESILIGLAAMAAGMVLGALFLKLFLMAMGALLNLSVTIPFAVPAGSIKRTAILFGCVFVLEGIVTAVRTEMRTPKSLMMSDKARQRADKASWWLVALGVAAIAVAYYLAVAQSLNIIFNFFPIIALTSVGTYLLFTQVSVKFLKSLRKRSLNGVSLLVAARFAHRLKDNARVLTVVTLLSAMVVSGMGAVFGTKAVLNQNSNRVDPFAVMLIAPKSETLPITADDVKGELNRAGTPVSGQVRFTIASTSVQDAAGEGHRPVHVTVISASSYERARQQLLKTEPEAKSFLEDAPPIPHAGSVNLFVNYPLTLRTPMFPSGKVRVSAVPGMVLNVNGQYDARVMNEPTGGGVSDYMLELADVDYAKVVKHLPASASYQVTGFSVPKWKHSMDVSHTLNHQLPKTQQPLLSTRVTLDAEVTATLGTMMFAGFFVSVLFLLACATALYFRLQWQMDADKRQFSSLLRIGMQRQEAKRTLTRELLLLFFAPVVVGLIHSAVAMVDFTHLIALSNKGTAWPVFFAVSGIFVLLMALSFIIARVRYARQVLS